MAPSTEQIQIKLDFELDGMPDCTPSRKAGLSASSKDERFVGPPFVTDYDSCVAGFGRLATEQPSDPPTGFPRPRSDGAGPVQTYGGSWKNTQ